MLSAVLSQNMAASGGALALSSVQNVTAQDIVGAGNKGTCGGFMFMDNCSNLQVGL